MALLNLCPEEVDLCVTRGDTQAFGFAILKPDGTADDLTGNSYLFTCNSTEEPADTADQVFQATGTIAANVVSVVLSTAQADNLGDFFYDLQETDVAGDIFTLAKGGLEFKQDITK